MTEAGDAYLERIGAARPEDLGIDYASLRDASPRLIYCSITPYGRTNRHSARPGYDALVAARSGRVATRARTPCESRRCSARGAQ